MSISLKQKWVHPEIGGILTLHLYGYQRQKTHNVSGDAAQLWVNIELLCLKAWWPSTCLFSLLLSLLASLSSQSHIHPSPTHTHTYTHPDEQQNPWEMDMSVQCTPAGFLTSYDSLITIYIPLQNSRSIQCSCLWTVKFSYCLITFSWLKTENFLQQSAHITTKSVMRSTIQLQLWTLPRFQLWNLILKASLLSVMSFVSSGERTGLQVLYTNGWCSSYHTIVFSKWATFFDCLLNQGAFLNYSWCS